MSQYLMLCDSNRDIKEVFSVAIGYQYWYNSRINLLKFFVVAEVGKLV